MMLPVVALMAISIKSEVETVPYRQPQLAAAHGLVAMTFGSGKSLYTAVSKDHGRSFGAPVKVGEVGALALGRHRGPRVAILKDAMVVSAIGGLKVATGPHAHGLPDSGDLLSWRSTDQGKTWVRGGVVNDVPGAAREGLHAMTAAPDGSLFAAWLDLRAKGTKLYGSRSTDGGRTWSKNVEIYSSPAGTICQCCHPTLTVDGAGRIWAMWRNVMDGSRDLYVIHSSDGVKFESAAKLGSGTWKLNACPMDGGGLLVENGKVTSAWRRESTIFLAEPGQPERQVGTGKDAAIARGGKGVYVAWTQEGGIRVASPGAAAPLTLAAQGGFANLARLEDGTVLAAWETQGGVEAKRLE